MRVFQQLEFYCHYQYQQRYNLQLAKKHYMYYQISKFILFFYSKQQERRYDVLRLRLFRLKQVFIQLRGLLRLRRNKLKTTKSNLTFPLIDITKPLSLVIQSNQRQSVNTTSISLHVRYLSPTNY